jgi:anaphase-promoting complex subunit 1
VKVTDKLQHVQNDLLNMRGPSLISKLIYGIATFSCVYTQHLNMIVAVDLTGGIVLYSGMTLVGKVHVAGIPSALTTSSYLSLNLGSQFTSPFPRYVNS